MLRFGIAFAVFSGALMIQYGAVLVTTSRMFCKSSFCVTLRIAFRQTSFWRILGSVTSTVTHRNPFRRSRGAGPASIGRFVFIYTTSKHNFNHLKFQVPGMSLPLPGAEGAAPNTTPTSTDDQQTPTPSPPLPPPATNSTDHNMV